MKLTSARKVIFTLVPVLFYRDKIRKEWGKTDADVQKDIGIIKDWLVTQKHLPEIPSDTMIEFFLTNCKYSIERTKQNVDMYYTARDLMPELYTGIHPITSNSLDRINDTADFVILPKLTTSLYRLNICKYRDIDSDQADIRKFMSHVVINFYEIRIHEDLAMGDIFIVDFEFMTFGVMNKLTPTFLKQFATILEKVHNNRMKELHFLYPPTYFDMILSLFKSFLSKKLQERIRIHHSLEELFESVPQELLPSDYGGKEKSLKELKELWKKKFADYKDRFDKLENMHIDESLRPEKLKNDEFLGFHGNFKKIDVD